MKHSPMNLSESLKSVEMKKFEWVVKNLKTLNKIGFIVQRQKHPKYMRQIIIIKHKFIPIKYTFEISEVTLLSSKYEDYFLRTMI